MLFLAAYLDNVWNHLHGRVNFWTVFGLAGNAMFTSRFVVQWYASEKRKQSVIPKNFWHLSLVGGVIQLIYALHIGAVPIILGYLLPPVIAARNLILIRRHSQGKPPGPPDAPRPDDGSPAPTAADPDRFPEAEGGEPSVPDDDLDRMAGRGHAR